MFKKFVVCGAIAMALSVSACAGKAKKPAPPANPGTAGSGISTGGFSEGSGTGSAIGAGTAGSDDTSGLDLTQRTVYFELDSSDIDSAGQAVIARFGKHLVSKPTAKLRLEGHADERGTREYNVGLGERRANAVQSALLAAGASASQISVVSYGEERPAVEGQDEFAWTKNRRVEIVQL